MLKKLTAILVLVFIASCAGPKAHSEMEKSAKSSAASERIRSSEGSSKDVFKELDE